MSTRRSLNGPETQTRRSTSSRKAWWIGAAVIATLVGYSLWPESNIVQEQCTPLKAVAVLSGSSDVSGVVYFSQGCLGHAASETTISGTIKGLDASSSRGFHVHELGDATDGCMSSGSHYNPLKFNHGAPSDHKRHVGDLGNIKSNSSGIAEFSFEDRLLSLRGPFSILGRTVVVHEGTDDLGKGNYSDSLTTGHAGGRAACGVIGIAA